MKKLLSLLFASMVVFSLTMPVLAQGTAPAATVGAPKTQKAKTAKMHKSHKTSKAVKPATQTPAKAVSRELCGGCTRDKVSPAGVLGQSLRLRNTGALPFFRLQKSLVGVHSHPLVFTDGYGRAARRFYRVKVVAGLTPARAGAGVESLAHRPGGIRVRSGWLSAALIACSLRKCSPGSSASRDS
jgi:hypothetical protein